MTQLAAMDLDRLAALGQDSLGDTSRYLLLNHPDPLSCFSGRFGGSQGDESSSDAATGGSVNRHHLVALSCTKLRLPACILSSFGSFVFNIKIPNRLLSALSANRMRRCQCESIAFCACIKILPRVCTARVALAYCVERCSKGTPSACVCVQNDTVSSVVCESQGLGEPVPTTFADCAKSPFLWRVGKL
jgi:hypothetical protein